MNVQSLSICVPGGCKNRCRYCVAGIHEEYYPNKLKDNPSYGLYYKNYIKRLEFARDNGCNTCMLKGNGDPVMNIRFLEMFGVMNRNLQNPFRWIEIQTSGTTVDENKLDFLMDHVGVSTVSLSVSSFDSSMNSEYNNTPSGYGVDIGWLCRKIKERDLNLRLSINLTDEFTGDPKHIFEEAIGLGADQLTFRVLYESIHVPDCEQNLWIRKHRLLHEYVYGIIDYVKTEGRPLEILPFGAIKYSVLGLSVVIDDDCMNNNVREIEESGLRYNALKYLILRPDCKLYSHWDEKGSLIF